MAEELIAEYVDRAKFASDTEFISQQLKIAIDAYSTLKNMKVDLQGSNSLKEISAAAKQAQIELTELKKKNLELSNALKELALQTRQNKASNDDYNKSVKATIAVENEVIKQITLEEKATRESIKTKKEQITYEQALAKEKAKGAAQAAAEAKIAAELTNEYALLNKALRDQELRYKNLALTQGFESEAAKEALQTALDTRNVLDKLDGNLRNYQRNVGNYKSAFDGLGMSFTQVARELPSLAINTQTFLLAISNNLPMVFDEIGKARNEIAALKAQGEEAPSLFSRIAKSAFSLQVGLSLLVTALTLFGPKLIEAISNLFGFADAEEAAAKATEKLIKAQLELIRTAKELNDVYNDPISDTNRLEKELLIAQALGKSKLEILEIEKKIAKERAVNANKAFFETQQDNGKSGFAALDDYKKKLLKVDIEYSDLVNKLSVSVDEEESKSLQKKIERKKIELDYFKERAVTQQKIVSENFNALTALEVKDAEITAELNKKKKDSQLSDLKDRASTEFERYQIRQEAKIRAFDQDIKSDKTHYLDKLKALDEYYKASSELIDRQYKEDVRKANEKAANDIKNLEESKAGKDPDQIARINENIKILEYNLQQELLLILEQALDRGSQLAQNTADTRNRITEEYLKKEKEYYEEFAKFEQDILDKTTDRLKKALAKRIANEKDFAEKQKALDKELNDAKVNAALGTEKALFSILTGGYKKQLNNIKDQQDEIDKRKERELAANDALVQSEQNKAANIVIINQRAQIQKEQLDRKSRDIQNQQAKFERAQQLFDISVNTIRSVAAIKLKAAELTAASALNPLLTPLIPLVLSQIPFAIGAGLASAAALLATPLPRFRTGLQRDHEGFGVVGDGGKKEAILRSSGAIEITPATDTLTYLNKGDRIMPDADAFMASAFGVAHNGSIVNDRSGNKPGADVSAALAQQNKYLKAIAGKPVMVINAKRSGIEAMLHWGASQTTYVNQNTNW